MATVNVTVLLDVSVPVLSIVFFRVILCFSLQSLYELGFVQMVLCRIDKFFSGYHK